eukprot:8086951-Pyramimonas_sp.AAC.1
MITVSAQMLREMAASAMPSASQISRQIRRACNAASASRTCCSAASPRGVSSCFSFFSEWWRDVLQDGVAYPAVAAQSTGRRVDGDHHLAASAKICVD